MCPLVSLLASLAFLIDVLLVSLKEEEGENENLDNHDEEGALCRSLDATNDAVASNVVSSPVEDATPRGAGSLPRAVSVG